MPDHIMLFAARTHQSLWWIQKLFHQSQWHLKHHWHRPSLCFPCLGTGSSCALIGFLNVIMHCSLCCLGMWAVRFGFILLLFSNWV